MTNLMISKFHLLGYITGRGAALLVSSAPTEGTQYAESSGGETVREHLACILSEPDISADCNSPPPSHPPTVSVDISWTTNQTQKRLPSVLFLRNTRSSPVDTLNSKRVTHSPI